MSFDWWPPGGPWPNTPGGVRGPDGRTLTDLYNVLSTVSSQLAALVTDSAAVRADIADLRLMLAVLSGDPAGMPVGWSGLPAYLRATVGPEQATDATTVLTQLANIAAYTAGIRLILRNNGLVESGDDIFPMALNTVLTYLPVLDLSRDIQNALLAVTGSITHDPAGSTIKDLLRSMDVNILRTAECCEEGGGGNGGNPNPENPEPEGFGCGTPLRVAGWVSRGMVNHGGVDVDIYQPDFGTLPVPQVEQFVGTDADGSWVAYGHTDNLRGQWCLSWDFTGNATIPVAWGRLTADTPTGAGAEQWLGGPTPGGTLTLGGWADEANDCDGTLVYRSYYFAVPAGAAPPGLNVWFGYQAMSCPS